MSKKPERHHEPRMTNAGPRKLYKESEILPLAIFFALAGLIAINFVEVAITALLTHPTTESRSPAKAVAAEAEPVKESVPFENEPTASKSDVTFTIRLQVNHINGQSHQAKPASNARSI